MTRGHEVHRIESPTADGPNTLLPTPDRTAKRYNHNKRIHQQHRTCELEESSQVRHMHLAPCFSDRILSIEIEKDLSAQKVWKRVQDEYWKFRGGWKRRICAWNIWPGRVLYRIELAEVLNGPKDDTNTFLDSDMDRPDNWNNSSG